MRVLGFLKEAAALERCMKATDTDPRKPKHFLCVSIDAHIDVFTRETKIGKKRLKIRQKTPTLGDRITRERKRSITTFTPHLRRSPVEIYKVL